MQVVNNLNEYNYDKSKQDKLKSVGGQELKPFLRGNK